MSSQFDYLEICRVLFQQLNECGIKYCHWKSNTHLLKALNGETDLDLLIHSKEKNVFESILRELSIIKIISPPAKQFSGVEDFLGFDAETGSLIHLHVHYRLVLGQRYIKNHHLPLEDLMFSNLTIKMGVSVPCPEFELFLLIIRAHMKTDVLSLVKHAIKRGCGVKNYTAFPFEIEKEFKELISEYGEKEFKKILQNIKLPLPKDLFTNFIKKFSKNELSFFDILRTQLKIFTCLKNFRRKKTVFVYTSYCSSFIQQLPFWRKFFRSPKKKLPQQGILFSIVGADGSGKSTLIDDLYRWLSWKLSTTKYYYGIPKTNSVKLYDWVIRGFRKIQFSLIANILDSILWIYIARVRNAVSTNSQKKVKQGAVVITDRFPLREFRAMDQPMDGPRLFKNVSILGEYFSRIETGFYDKILLPDLIFVLQVDIEELRRRKTDLDISTHRIKAEAVNALTEDCGVLLIDANKPYREVLLEIKRKIWGCFQV